MRVPMLIAVLLYACAAIGLAQDQDVPKKALCAVCVLRGESEEEKVKAYAEYEGKTFYFCSKACEKEFLTDPAGYAPPVLPRPAPEILFETLDGKDTALASFKGKVVLLDFWATWCKPCLHIMPKLQELHSRYEQQGFTVVGIAIDEDKNSIKKIRRFAEKLKISYPIYRDAKNKPAWHTFGVKAIPATYLIDRGGQIIAQWTGTIDHEEIEAAAIRLLSDEN